MMDRYKMVFLGQGLCRWGGGVDYLCQIVSAYAYISHQTQDMEIEMTVIIPYIDKLNPDYSLKTTLIENLLKIDPSIKIVSLLKEESLKERIIALQPDLIIPYLCGAFRDLSAPYVSYIPDFQEEYLKDFFSAYEIVKRRQNNAFVLSHAPYIIATSKSVALDMEKFYGRVDAHVFIQPFAPFASREYWDTGNADLAKYKLPERYFIISNQFWMHKDHLTAFKAVHQLLEMGHKDIHLVCTGKMSDYRNESYQKQIRGFIEEFSLENNIKLLGYIPKTEQIEIMKNAVALVQPSLFEGDPGGCSGYEAVSYGRPVIMSDIAVNLEADGTENLYFYKVGDYMELAFQMKGLLDAAYVPYNVEIVQRIYCKNVKKTTDFYLDILRSVGRGVI